MRTKQMFIAKEFILSVLLTFIIFSTGTYAQENNQDKIHKKQPIDSVSLIASYRQAVQVQRAEYIRYSSAMLQENIESASKAKQSSGDKHVKIANINPGIHSKGYLWINNEKKSDTPEEFIVTQPSSPLRLNFDFEQSSEKGCFVVEIKDHLGKIIYSKSSQELKACRTTKNYYYRYHCLERVELDTGSYSVSLRHISNKNSSKDIKHAFSKDNTKATTTSEEESYYDGIMLLSYGFQGETFSNPIDVGTFSGSFTFFDSQDITDYDDDYTGSSNPDIFYKFTLCGNIDVTITHCGSSVVDSYMYLLDSAGNQIEFNNNYTGAGKCSNIRLSRIKRSLSPGTYYVVSEAYGMPEQMIDLNISGVAPVGDNIQDPVVVGTFSSNFKYTDTKNTALYTNLYNGRPTNDVYYKFSLTRRMQVTVTHCGSFVEDTYVHLLDSVGNVIVFSDDDEDGNGECGVVTQSFMQKELSAGTYYIVSEGWSINGQIQTKIVGVVDEFGYSVMPNGYSADATGVGTVGGSMSVSPTGAAIYSVPIECPQGVGGMQPSISLVYNSQSGNGIAGYGTNISGLSAITRGPKDIYHDGEAKAMTYYGSDAFYLDGQRLIHVSGTPGQDGAIYHPESDPFTVVVVHGTHIGPACHTWFEVTKNGTKCYYGSDTISLQVLKKDQYDASKVKTWHINYVEDVMGNYTRYTYNTVALNQYLTQISYGKNINESQTLLNTIRFSYQSRTDTIPFVLAGIRGEVSQRLSSVSSYTGDVLFRNYALNYSQPDSYSRLISITKGSSGGDDLKPTTIMWNSFPSFSNYSSSNIAVNESFVLPSVSFQNQYMQSADLNGDGVPDLIGLYQKIDDFFNRAEDHARVYIGYRDSVGNPVFQPSNIDITLGSSLGTSGGGFNYSDKDQGCLPINFYGDGKAKLLVPIFRDGTTPIVDFQLINDVGTSVSVGVPLILTHVMPTYTVADMNNDGKDDIIMIEKREGSVAYPCQIIYNQSDTICHADYGLSLAQKPERTFVFDFNGDGLNDILVFYQGGYTIFWNKGPGISTQTFVSTQRTDGTNIANCWKITPGDFNGDGMIDFLMNATGSTQWYFALSNGDGTFTKRLACVLPVYDNDFTTKDDIRFGCQVFDVDYDGKSDVIITKAIYHKESNIFKSWGEFDITKTYWMHSTGANLSQVGYSESNNEEDARSQYYVTGDFNGDGRVELMNYGYNCLTGEDTPRMWRMYKNATFNAGSGKINTVSSGAGSYQSVNYSSLLHSNLYTKGSGSVYPVNDIYPALSVVKTMYTSNGQFEPIELNYMYGGAKVHLQGKGFLGMMSSKVVNSTTGVTVESESRNLHPTLLVPTETYSKTTIGSIQEETTTAITVVDKGSKQYFAYSNQTVNVDMDGNSTTQYKQYDNANGYLTQERTEYGSPNMYKSTQYGNFIFAGGAYKPQLITVSQKHSDDPQIFTKQTSITYNTLKGYPLTRVENYGTPMPLTTSYTSYDNFGNCTGYQISGYGLSTMSYYTEYDATKRFVVRKYTSPATPETTYSYDTWGNVLTETVATNPLNPLTTTYTYDGWGQKTSELSPEGIRTTYQSGWNGNNYDKSYFTLIQGPGQPWVKTWYDNLGRETSVESIGPKNIPIKSEKVYDNKGQLIQTILQRGDQISYGDFTYDTRGRVLSNSSSVGKNLTYGYGNRTQSTTDNGRTYTKVFDVWGNVVSSVDPISSVTYTYSSSGKPISITSGGASSTMTYDVIGNQLTLTDPNAGTTTYTYDATGRVKTQVDGKGNTRANYYDGSNRLSYTTLGGVRTDYTYGTSGNNANRLTKVATSTNSVSYTYDTYGRMITENRKVGPWNDYIDLNKTYYYNNIGSLEHISYPTRTVDRYEYDSYGNLVKIFAGNAVAWELTGETGLVTTAKLGANITSTNTHNSQGLLENMSTVKGTTTLHNMSFTFNGSTGNLTSRTGMIAQREAFYYDDLDRLVSVKHGTPEIDAMNITYEPNGNISSKTDLGAYTYAISKPHALESVQDSNALIPCGDLNVTYTAFNKISSIQNMGTDADYYTLNYEYGTDEERCKAEISVGGELKRSTIYAPDYESVTEYVEETDYSTKTFRYISSPTGLAAVYVTQAGLADKIYYANTDHQGSIISLCDGNGTIVFKASYDAWGKQTIVTNTIGFRRGYTGHEHLEGFGLINMNGRVYDPDLGRFMSPDNYVQAPDLSQNFNRYSYCLNNPLKYTDPSGEFFWLPIIIGATIGAYSGYKIADSKGYDLGDWQTYGYMVGGAAIGGFSGYVGASIAAGGVSMANTMGIAYGSMYNSMGMSALSGGMILPSVSSGVASFDLGTGEWGYLGKKGNSALVNIIYGFGALANLSDVMAGFNPGDVELRTENDPNYTKSQAVYDQNGRVTGYQDVPHKDLIGHSQLSDGKGNVLIDWGPTKTPSGFGDWVGGTNSYEKGNLISAAEMQSSPLTISGVNTARIAKYASYLNKGGQYNLVFNSCVSQTSRALNMSGVFNIGIHPYILQAQMYLRSIGVRPMLFSQYLYNRHSL